MPEVIRRLDDRRFDHLRAVVEVGLLPAARQGAHGQAQVVDKRAPLLADIGAAAAPALEQIVLDELASAWRIVIRLTSYSRASSSSAAMRSPALHSPPSSRRRTSAAIWK